MAAPTLVRRTAITVAVVALLAGGEAALSRGLNPYAYDILIRIGITIVLAVSLNLINGFTGQFSLGHAGFMAVGAYTAATLTKTFGAKLLPLASGQPWIL